MISNQLSQFIAACIVVNVIIIGIIMKYSNEEMSFTTLLTKFGIPLCISEMILLLTLYSDETFDMLIGDGEFFQEIFESESEQTFANTNTAHVIHSHGDVAENNLHVNNLRRRISTLSATS